MVQCCVCGLTKDKTKLSFFTVPKDANLRELWSTILNHSNTTLQENDLLCENHFASSDVLKCLQVNDVQIPNKKVRLRKGCLPIPCLTKIDPDTETEIKEEDELQIKSEPEFVDTDNIDFQEEIDGVKQELAQFHSEDVGDFFDNIFTTHSLPGLTEYWGIHSCDPNIAKIKPCMVLITEVKPRCILFSQMDVRASVPIFGRQVVLSENLEMKYFIRQDVTIDHLSLPKVCTSPEELQKALNKFCEFRLCQGGPHCSEYSEIAKIISCANRDYSSMAWRHMHCDYIAVDGLETCAHCVNLQKYFKVTLKKLDGTKRKRKQCTRLKDSILT